MTYLSYGFAVFLLFGLILFYLVPSKYQWWVLLMLSVAFYIFIGKYGFVSVAATIIITFFGGKLIYKKRKENTKYMNVLFICSFVNIIMLAIGKAYFSFSGDKILLPLGMAFYTLMSVGYLIDIGRGAFLPQENIAKLSLYLLYFPHIVIGPISRYSEVADVLYSGKQFETENFFSGIKRIIWGAFKKLVIANRIMPVVEELSGNMKDYHGSYVVALMILYAIELYTDFSGGIDIVLGVSRLFGIKLQENFIRPYFSKNLAEYWRRWHISMSTWFRDYMYYPISTSEQMQKIARFFRKKNRVFARKLPVYCSLIIVWLATGLWHGVAVNYVTWGLMNGILLILFKELEGVVPKLKCQSGKYLAVMGTFLLTSALKLFDCYEGLGAFAAFGTIFTTFNPGIFINGGLLIAGTNIWDYIVIATGCVMIFISSLAARTKCVSERLREYPLFVEILLWGSLVVACIVLGVYGIGYEKADFIYNRF